MGSWVGPHGSLHVGHSWPHSCLHLERPMVPQGQAGQVDVGGGVEPGAAGVLPGAAVVLPLGLGGM